MFAETAPVADAMSWLATTLSPGLTAGVAGAPMCCEVDTASCAGRGISLSGDLAQSYFLSSGWTPPRKLKVFRMFTTPS